MTVADLNGSAHDGAVTIELTPAGMPTYRNRFPCPECGTGYLNCADLANHDLKCCKGCSHPGRFDTAEPYTDEEIDDMWQRAGKPRPT